VTATIQKETTFPLAAVLSTPSMLANVGHEVSGCAAATSLARETIAPLHVKESNHRI
jgi:hypothetical protein